MAVYSTKSLGCGIFTQGDVPIAMVMPDSVTKVSDTEVVFTYPSCTVTVTADSNDGETVKGLGYSFERT